MIETVVRPNHHRNDDDKEAQQRDKDQRRSTLAGHESIKMSHFTFRGSPNIQVSAVLLCVGRPEIYSGINACLQNTIECSYLWMVGKSVGLHFAKISD